MKNLPAVEVNLQAKDIAFASEKATSELMSAVKDGKVVAHDVTVNDPLGRQIRKMAKVHVVINHGKGPCSYMSCWMDLVTGSLYEAESGRCLSSNQLGWQRHET